MQVFAVLYIGELSETKMLNATNSEGNQIVNANYAQGPEFFARIITEQLAIEMNAKGKLQRSWRSEGWEHALVECILHILNGIHSQLTW